jgi:hypothetical protein
VRGEHLGGQGDERSGESVDLVSGEGGAVGQVRLLLGQQALEAEDERVVLAPLDRGLLAPRIELGQRGLECDAARGALRERGRGVLPFEHERLAGKAFCAF